MGLLDRAYNLAVKAYNYVVGSDNKSEPASNNNSSVSASKKTSTAKPQTSTAAKTSEKVNSVTNPEGKLVDKIGDTVEKTVSKTSPKSSHKSSKSISNKNTDNTIKMQSKVKFSQSKNNKSSSKTKIDEAIKNMKIKIMQKCTKFGISFEEAEATILAQMQFSYEEFNALSPEEQLSVLLSIDGAIGLYIIDTGKRRVNASVDKAALIGQTARNIIEAKEQGAIEDISEFEDAVGDINQELDGKISDDTTEEEYAKILSESKRAFRASIEVERLAEIKKCNGDKAKIAEINRRYKARLHAFEAQRQTDFIAAQEPENSRLSIYLRGAENYSEAHAIALSLYTGNQRTIVADSFNHEFEMKARQFFYESGDPVSVEEYSKAVSYTTQYMSEDALNKFQSDAITFRQKVKKGEVKAPFMSEKDFEAEAAAIAVGIVKNVNMTESSKKAAIYKLNKDISDFKDSEQDVQTIKTVINDNEKIFAHLLSDKELKSFITNPVVKNEPEKPMQKADSQTLAQALLSMPYDQVRANFTKNSDKDFVEVVIQNPKLKNQRQYIVPYLKILQPEDLKDITQGCCTDMFLFVLRNVSPEKAGRLYDLSKDEKCYAARELGERIIEEGQKDAAA